MLLIKQSLKLLMLIKIINNVFSYLTGSWCFQGNNSKYVCRHVICHTYEHEEQRSKDQQSSL